MSLLARFLPPWAAGYGRSHARRDLVAGLVVVVMLVPQSLAYALLAGLPAQAGLYASILPIAVYAAFGSSRTLAVGPVAVLSLMTASALAPLAAPGSLEYARLALVLAGMSGAVLLGLGALRLGVVANLLSHPVIAGFATGSALLIIVGQLQALAAIPGVGHTALELTHALVLNARAFDPTSLALGSGALMLLVLAKRHAASCLRALGCGPTAADIGMRLAPVVVVAAATALTAALALDVRTGLKVVGPIPQGLPALAWSLPDAASLRALLLPAAAIALVGFVESVSVAQSLALKRQERIDANRELLGLGAANLAAAAAGGMPVTGGFSRTVVNDAAGAQSPLAGVVAALTMLGVVTTMSGAFEKLPICVLAATIIVPASSLVDLAALRRAWRYARADGLAFALTALGVVAAGVEVGIALGLLLSLTTVVWQASRPHIAIVGRVPGTEQFRNVNRVAVETLPHLLAMRVDENLFFGNVPAVEVELQRALAARPATTDVLLVMSSVSAIDMTALERLEELNRTLAARGLRLHFSDLKGPVRDRLRRSRLFEDLSGREFRYAHEAFDALAADARSATPA
ncbi:MAG TPA: sulfate permease [Gammaproteobacteria bacterium]|nr:sulfate permease [Gammaproteobacteria bacterium]